MLKESVKIKWSKTSIALSMLLIALVFGSCSKNDNRDAANNHILFWNFCSDDKSKAAMAELIAEFEKENDCKVELSQLNWSDGKTKLLAAFNSGTAPDVLELGSDWVAQFSSSGCLLELNADSFAVNNYEEFSLEPSYWNKKLYAIPWVIDSRALFYNKTLLRQAGLSDSAPATLEELISASEAISAIDGVWGFGANGSDPHVLYKKILYFMWTYGGGVLDKDGNPVIFSPENIQAFDVYINLSKYGMLDTQRELDAMFLRGKIGFWISGSWLPERIMTDNPSLDFGIAPLPGLTKDKPGISFAGGEYLAINAKTKNQMLAQKLVKFICDGKKALQFSKNVPRMGFPADKKYFTDEYFKSQPYRAVIAEQLKYSRMTPVNPHWLDIEEKLENAVVEALYGKESSSEALRKAQDDIEAILKQ